MDLKQRTYSQARRQAVWAAVWMVAAIVATLARPEGASPRQWLTDQAVVGACMLALFQLGRMFQSLVHVRLLDGSSASPVVSGMGDDDASVPPEEVPAHVWLAREVHAYSTVEEAERNGWEFTAPVAQFGGKPVPSHARFLGRVYVYDGLTTDAMLRALPQDRRVFGRLLYKQTDPAPEAPGPSDPLVSP